MNRERLRILLLDDEESLRVPLQRRLMNSFGYAVDTVSSGEEALELVHRNRGNYDVALLDQVLLPGPDGIEVMQQIKLSYPGIECIIFTGWGTTERQRALQAGAFRYLEKPFSVDELAVLIRRAAEQPLRPDKVSQYNQPDDYIAVGDFNGVQKLVALSEDGTYRYLDSMQKLHNIIYVASPEAPAMEEAVEEFEALLNDPKTGEAAFQDFFERYPQFILNDEYKKAHPQIALARDEGPLIPDFLLEPLDQSALCDILELKLPTAKVFVLKQSRMRFSAAVMEACAQLREYSSYFEEKVNRERVQQEYGLLAYKPKMFVIIGRRGAVDPILKRRMESDLPSLVLRTYDDVLARVKARYSIS